MTEEEKLKAIIKVDKMVRGCIRRKLGHEGPDAMVEAVKLAARKAHMLKGVCGDTRSRFTDIGDSLHVRFHFIDAGTVLEFAFAEELKPEDRKEAEEG